MSNKNLTGLDPHQVPTNQDLGVLAYRDSVDTSDISVDQGIYPNTRPNIMCDFRNSETLHPALSCRRKAVRSTRINRYGEIEYMGYGEPRFDYDPYTLKPRGLLIEGQRTNKVTYSEDASQWTAAGGTKNNNHSSTRAPDGSFTATMFTKNGSAQANLQIPMPAAAHTYHTVSAFIKPDTTNKVFYQFVTTNAVTNLYVYLNLETETYSYTDFNGSSVVQDVWFEKFSDGWVRVKIYCSGFGNTGAASGIRFGTYASANTHSYNNSTHSFYIWGCQFESGALRASSYIPVAGLTAGSEVVRQSDAYSFTLNGYRTHGAKYTRGYQQKAGVTYYVEFEQEQPIDANVYSGLVQTGVVGGTSTDNRNNLALYRGGFVENTHAGSPYHQFTTTLDGSGTSASASIQGGATGLDLRPKERTVCRIAATTIPDTRQNGDSVTLEMSVDGYFAGISTASNPIGPQSYGEMIHIALGMFDNSGSTIEGYMRKFAVYPKALTRREMNYLTGDLPYEK